MCHFSCFIRVRITDCSYSSDKYEEQRRVWGGGIRGNKSTQMLRKRAKAAGQNISAASIGKL
jgi:large subunit ribosomal protein L7Ae